MLLFDDPCRSPQDSFWEPADTDVLGDPKWDGLISDEEVLQPEDELYGADADKPEDGDDDDMMEALPATIAQRYRINSDLLRDRARSDRMQGFASRETVIKRAFGPRGFYASRGKRFVPGMEALLLARYYEGTATESS